MKKFKLGKDILILTIITLITVLTWVSFEVWSAATKTTIAKVTKDQLAPINPNISQEVIESLKINFNPSEEEMTESLSSPSAIPTTEETTPSPQPAATESSQTATESSQASTESAILE